MLSTLLSIASDNNIEVNYDSTTGSQVLFPSYIISLDTDEITTLAQDLDMPYNDVLSVILAHELGHCLAMLNGSNGYDEWTAWEYAERIHPNTLLFSGLREFALNGYIEEYGSIEIARYSFAMDFGMDYP